ncbi:MAG TPA: hypothetical protein VF306_09480 [Pirellulales bacterium]
MNAIAIVRIAQLWFPFVRCSPRPSVLVVSTRGPGRLVAGNKWPAVGDRVATFAVTSFCGALETHPNSLRQAPFCVSIFLNRYSSMILFPNSNDREIDAVDARLRQLAAVPRGVFAELSVVGTQRVPVAPHFGVNDHAKAVSRRQRQTVGHAPAALSKLLHRKAQATKCIAAARRVGLVPFLFRRYRACPCRFPAPKVRHSIAQGASPGLSAKTIAVSPNGAPFRKFRF